MNSMGENKEEEFMDIEAAIKDIEDWFKRAEEFHCDDSEVCLTCEKLSMCIHGLDKKTDDIFWYILQILRILKLFNEQADKSFKGVDKILGKLKNKKNDNKRKIGYIT